MLTNWSFDLVLQGDDPGELFRFDLQGSATVPSVVRFEGTFENLDLFETGLSWGLESAELGGFDSIDFTRLPGSGQLPVEVVRWNWFTPDKIVVHIEGGGPGDHFRFVGKLTVEQVATHSVTNCLPLPKTLTWWPGDLVTNDFIGGRHVALRGGAGYGPGIVREAFTLNGNGQFVEVPYPFDFYVGTNDFTFELWVRFNNPEGEQVIAEKFIETMTPSNQGWTLTKLPNHVIRFAMAGGRNVDSPPAGTITSSSWTHIAVRRNGDTFTTFQNGSPTGSGDFSVNLNSMSTLKFGHRGNPEDTPGSADTRNFWLNGAIDEPAFYNRALSDQEIASIFQAGATGKCRRPIVLALAPPSSGAVRVTVKGLPNLPHVLEGSSDLNRWNPLTTNTPTTEVFHLDALDGGVRRAILPSGRIALGNSRA